MNKLLFPILILGTLLFVGCSEKNIVKEEIAPVPTAPTASEDVYGFVIAKSIRECAEHNITLNPERTDEFMRRSPKSTIDKAAQSEVKTTQDLCHFFSEETSLEKLERIDELANKIISSCEKVGISLPRETIHNKVHKLPFFIIKKGLAMEDDSSLEECQVMEQKYK